jgi:hypothetical protein
MLEHWQAIAVGDDQSSWPDQLAQLPTLLSLNVHHMNRLGIWIQEATEPNFLADEAPW